MATKRNLHSPLFVPSLGKKVKMEEHGSGSSEAARGHEVGSSEQIWQNAVQAIFGSQAKGFSLAQAEDIKQEMDEEEQKMLAKEITKRQQFRQINQEGHGAASTVAAAAGEHVSSHPGATSSQQVHREVHQDSCSGASSSVVDHTSKCHPCVDVPASLGEHLLPATKERILKGEYVDFFSLLFREPEPRALVKDGILHNLPMELEQVKRPKIERNFLNWLAGFNIYVDVLLEAHCCPHRALFRYQDIILRCHNMGKGTEWLQYDQQFRMSAAGNPTLPWDRIHSELWSDVLVSNWAYPDYCGDNGFVLAGSWSKGTYARPVMARKNLSVCWDYNAGIATPEAGTSQLQAVTHNTDNASIAAEMQLLQEYFLHEEDMVYESTSLAREQEVPWFGFEKAVTFVCQKEKNLIVRCNFCLPVVKNISSPISSSSNVKLHFQKAHPEQLRAILSAVEARRSETLHGLPPIRLPKHQKPKQATLERWGFGKDTVTQNMLDRNIMDLIVGEALPLQIVEKPLFVRLVLLGLPKGLTVMCAQTLRERIERRAANMRETLAIQMGAVAQVATTADCWTDGKKRYLGVIAYWISPVTLNYEFGALACKRLKGNLTYSVLTKALHEVYVQYGIQNKIVCTTTDNSCNFVKAFCFLKAKELVDATNTSPDNDVEDDDVQEEAEMEFLPISESLDTVKKEDEEAADLEDFSLPPHHRCVGHTLTLVVTQDIEAVISNASKSSSLFFFRKHFSSLMEKCSKLWSKQKQSKQLADYIHKQCGVYLKVPSKNRWNSTFDALKQLNELLSTLPLKVDAIMDRCSVARFTPEENLVVQEYTEIMWPLVLSLNILQGKNGMFMGYLLPTLYSLDHKLEVLENKPVKYTYCLQLLRSVRTALKERFAPFWDDKKLFLAACLHPHFKLDWLGSAQIAQINRDAMEALLKTEIQNTKVYRDGFSENNQEGDSLESGFFSFKSRGKKPEVETADEEVLRYLMCPSREMSSLHAFPRIMKSFLQYNTGIPSSAATEHLFSTDGNNTILNRYHFSDDLFEQLVLLRQNRAVC